jgi:hypothetical protein
MQFILYTSGCVFLVAYLTAFPRGVWTTQPIYSRTGLDCPFGVLTGDEALLLSPLEKSIKYRNGSRVCARLFPADVVHCGFGVPDASDFVCISVRPSDFDDSASPSITARPLSNVVAQITDELNARDVATNTQPNPAYSLTPDGCEYGVQNDHSLLKNDAKFFYGNLLCAHNSTLMSISCPSPPSFLHVRFVCRAQGGRQTSRGGRFFRSLGGIEGVELFVGDDGLFAVAKKPILFVLECEPLRGDIQNGCKASLYHLRL